MYGKDWPHYAVDPVFWNNINWMPEHVLASIPAKDHASSEYARKPLGEGPYVVKEWKAGQEIVLEKSSLPFPLGDAKIKTVTYRMFGDGAGVLAALQNGEIDLALGNPAGLTEANAPDLDAIESAGLYQVEWIPEYSYEHLDINVTKPPLDDVRVRRALAYALDRQQLSDTLYYGKKVITDLPLPKGLSWAYPPDSDLSIYPFDLDKAKALLAEAGWDCAAMPCTKTENGQTKRLEFTLMTTDRTDRTRLAQVVQQMWKQLNVGVNLQFLYGRGLFATCSANGPLNCRTFDAAIYTFSTDDSATFNTTYACGAIPNKENNWSGQNYPGWCNPAGAEALNESENNPEIAISREKRLPYLKTFFKAMTDDLPVIYFYGSAVPYPHRVNWVNFRSGSTQYSLPTWNSWEWEVSR
jgi:peptide/nickel transport system substrate-binding protein